MKNNLIHTTSTQVIERKINDIQVKNNNFKIKFKFTVKKYDPLDDSIPEVVRMLDNTYTFDDNGYEENKRQVLQFIETYFLNNHIGKKKPSLELMTTNDTENQTQKEHLINLYDAVTDGHGEYVYMFYRIMNRMDSINILTNPKVRHTKNLNRYLFVYLKKFNDEMLKNFVINIQQHLKQNPNQLENKSKILKKVI